VSKQTIQPYQIRVYMKARAQGLSQPAAAAVAEISERSGQRIESATIQPNRGRMRNWRTSPDPLAEVWETELEPMLRREPRLKPMTLFEYLQERYPGRYGQVLRTLQRRVETWKALYGKSPEVMFELRHEPGVMGISDFTTLKGVTITIAGQAFEHLLYHYRLTYSGWEYAQVIQGGESFIALSEGLQNALFLSGGVPQQHRTDSLSAAYRNLGGKAPKSLTRLYDELCDHYRLEPTRNNRGIAHENGAIESPHGHLKNRITQALYLRDSYDFDSVKDYQSFIEGIVATLNQRRAQKFAEEQRYLQPLPKYRVADYEVLSARVSSRSTIDVRCILYTVPSRLIGRRLELHLYHDRIVGYLGQQQVVELPRVRVSEPDRRRARCINYRHVIEGLRRKPRAFIYCTWREDLLPNDHYRRLWQQMQTQFDLDSAAVVMVESLYIAATQNKETAVADYLETQLQAHSLTLTVLRRHFQLRHDSPFPAIEVQQHALAEYDHLLTASSPEALPLDAIPLAIAAAPTADYPPFPHTDHDHDQPNLDPTSAINTQRPHPQCDPSTQPTSQDPTPLSHAQPVGSTPTPSLARTVVLRSILAGTVRLGGQPTLDSTPRTQTKRRRTASRKNGFQL
jgi:hypothetical protein